MYPQALVDALVRGETRDGLLVLSPDGDWLSGNPQADSLLGGRTRALPEPLLKGLVALRERPPDGPVLVELLPPDVRAPLRAELDGCGAGEARFVVVRLVEPGVGAPHGADRWRIAVDNAEDGVWDWDALADRVFFSSRWKSMLGYADHEVGDTLAEWSQRVHPDDLEATYAAIADHFEGRAAVYRSEHRVRHKDGSWRWILDRGKVVAWTADGKPARVVGSHTDITRYREQEVRLLEQAAALRAAHRLARIGSWSVDPDRQVVEWSPELAELAGLPAEAILPDLAMQRRAFDDDDYARQRDAVRAARADGHGFDLEVSLHRVDGQVLRVRMVCEPVRDASGRIVRLVGAVIDLTEVLREREELRLQTAIMDRMSMLAQVGGWVLEAGADAPVWTDQTYRIHGLAPRTPVPLGEAYAFYPGDALATIRNAVVRALSEGVPYDLELPFTTAAGEPRWVRVSGQPDPAGGPIERVFGAIHDITDARRLQVDLQAAQVALQQRNADLSAFASVAAHDLKEPLRKIESFTRMIAADSAASLDAVGRDRLGRVQRTAARMQALIDDLLSLARAGSGTVDVGPVALDPLLDEVLEVLAGAVAQSGAEIRRDPLPVIEGDRRLLRQMLQNLLSNAVKFRDPARPLVVGIHAEPVPGAEPACVRLDVTDNGIGFEPAEAARILRPFERLHGRVQYEGAGLGLALVDRVVARHGGRLEAIGEPGRGARFVVELPVHQPQAAGASAALLPMAPIERPG